MIWSVRVVCALQLYYWYYLSVSLETHVVCCLWEGDQGWWDTLKAWGITNTHRGHVCHGELVCSMNQVTSPQLFTTLLLDSPSFPCFNHTGHSSDRCWSSSSLQPLERITIMSTYYYGMYLAVKNQNYFPTLNKHWGHDWPKSPAALCQAWLPLVKGQHRFSL